LRASIDVQLVPAQRGDGVDQEQRAGVPDQAPDLGQRLVRARRRLRVHHRHHLGLRVRAQRLGHGVHLDRAAPRDLQRVHGRPVAPGHVLEPPAERAGDGDDHLVPRFDQVGHAGLHAGAARPGDGQRQRVLRAEHGLQHRARLVHHLQVDGIQVADGGRGQRRQHARRDVAGAGT
jgi:hypothetical protein